MEIWKKMWVGFFSKHSVYAQRPKAKKWPYQTNI